MAQVIAIAVYGPVFTMKAPVAAILPTSMTGAPGQLFDFLHLRNVRASF